MPSAGTLSVPAYRHVSFTTKAKEPAMTNTAIALSDETLTALDVLVKGRFSTVVVETQNSVYTVVVRRDYATVIHNTRKPLVGTDVYVIGLKTGHPTLLLRNNHDDLTVLHTTAIQRAYVLEN